MSTELLKIASDIRRTLSVVREERGLKFEEEEHRYEMYDVEGNITDKYPSVSSVLKYYFEEFNSDSVSVDMCEKGNPKAAPFMIEAGYDITEGARLLRESWTKEGTIASNFGSYTHFKLEQYIWNLYDDLDKIPRKPHYNLSEYELEVGMELTQKGVDMIHNIIGKGFIPLDTEVIMGSNKYGYFGQADNIWIGYIDGKLGLLMTDWKTNKSKNMVDDIRYDDLLPAPLDIIRDNTKGKYMIQQILYGILFIDMLKGTEYEDLEFFGFRILKLRDTPEVIKIPKSLFNRTLELLDKKEW